MLGRGLYTSKHENYEQVKNPFNLSSKMPRNLVTKGQVRGKKCVRSNRDPWLVELRCRESVESKWLVNQVEMA